MRCQDPGNDYYTPDISLKSRGDFYGNANEDDDEYYADGVRRHTKPWTSNKYNLSSPLPEELDYSVDSCDNDDESTAGERSWSFVSSGNSKEGACGKGKARTEKDEGTTGFSLEGSTWYTPEMMSTSSGGQSSVVSLDNLMMGNWRKKSNIVLRRSLKHADPVIAVFGGMNPDEPLREDLGESALDVLVHCSTVVLSRWFKFVHLWTPVAYSLAFTQQVHRNMLGPSRRLKFIHLWTPVAYSLAFSQQVHCSMVVASRWFKLVHLWTPVACLFVAFTQRVHCNMVVLSRSIVTRWFFLLLRWFKSVHLWTPVAYSLAFTTDSGGQLWLWGGVTEDGRPLGELRCWSPKHKAWKRCCQLAPPRHGFSGASVGNQVSIFGGFVSERGTASDAHTQLNVSEQTMHDARPLPCPLAGSSALTVSGYRRSPSLKSLPS
ncbi:unnamed protein product, partial [Ixodes hexagonus]